MPYLGALNDVEHCNHKRVSHDCAKAQPGRASLTATARASLSKQLEHWTTSPAMALQLLERKFPNDHLPLLRWLMFTGVCAFGFVLAWHYGLFHLMLASDKTYISLVIVVLYIATSVHCLVRTLTISRELDSAQRVAALVRQGVDGFS